MLRAAKYSQDGQWTEQVYAGTLEGRLNPTVRWRSWLSHLSNTQKVPGSSPGRIILFSLRGVDSGYRRGSPGEQLSGSPTVAAVVHRFRPRQCLLTRARLLFGEIVEHPRHHHCLVPPVPGCAEASPVDCRSHNGYIQNLGSSTRRIACDGAVPIACILRTQACHAPCTSLPSW